MAQIEQDTEQETIIRQNNLSRETQINLKAANFKTDLFKSKKTQILDFIKLRHYVKTSDLIKFGLSLYTNRGDRYGRDLAEEGRIRRLSDSEKIMRFGRIREDIWEFIK